MNASGAGGHGWAPMNSERLCGGRLCVCARACMHACMRDVFAIYEKYLTQADNNNLNYYPIFHTNQTL